MIEILMSCLVNITDLWEKYEKKYVTKFMQDNLKNSMMINLTKNRFLQQVQKTEPIN